MASKKVKRRNIRKQKKTAASSPFNIYWTKRNYLYLLLGVVVIVIGFYFMSIGPWDSFSSLVISPILLVIGYVFIFPMSILHKEKKSSTEGGENIIGDSAIRRKAEVTNTNKA
jgi:membrane protein YdbS with pleckstrin-like domain